MVLKSIDVQKCHETKNEINELISILDSEIDILKEYKNGGGFNDDIKIDSEISLYEYYKNNLNDLLSKVDEDISVIEEDKCEDLWDLKRRIYTSEYILNNIKRKIVQNSSYIKINQNGYFYTFYNCIRNLFKSDPVSMFQITICISVLIILFIGLPLSIIIAIICTI